MKLIRTTDNNCGKPISKLGNGNFEDLSFIANKKIYDINLVDNTNLLIFPHNWQLGIHKSDRIFELSNDGILTTNNIMGFIGYNETSLAISSRFYSNGNDFFLHYMLCKIFGINVVNLDFPKGDIDIHDFLPYLFPSYLQDALSQGLYKQYKRNQYNDANVKGVIDINRHIKINIPFAGKIAYTAREHSYDNPVTQLIRHTIEHLRNRVFGHSILTNNAEIRANVSQIEYATPTYKRGEIQKVIKSNLKIFNHPYFTKYKNLQKLCLQILRGEKTTYGEKDKIHGLLFDGSWLWEEYVATILKDKGIEHRTTIKDYLFVKDEISQNQGIIPDFICPIKNTKNASFVGDAKYKHIDTNKNREDYFQIISYMFRYSCNNGYLLFPFDKENKNADFLKGRIRKIDNGNNCNIIELGLNIPQNIGDFKDFKQTIKQNEQELLKKIEV